MRYIYCPECGTKLTEIAAGDDGMVPYCEKCRKRWFDSFHSCVVVLTYNELNEIVLSKQWYLPEQYYSVTTGYIVPGENAEEAAVREVREELGIEIKSLVYAGTYWLEPTDQLLHGFIAFAPKQDLKLSSEIPSAEWVPAMEASARFFPDKPGGALYELYRKFLQMQRLSFPGI